VQPADPPTLYAGPRGTAIKILNRVERSDAYLDKLLDAELKASELQNVDKGLMAELVHGTIRWQGRLDWLLNRFTHGNFSKSEINVKNSLRIALYQILFLDRMPHYAVVNEAVEFIKKVRGDKYANLVNAVLRNIIRSLDAIRYPSKEDGVLQYLSVFYSHPPWMVKRWLARFPEDDVEKFLTANNEVPQITLRINKLKIPPPSFLTALDGQGIAYQGSAFIDYFIKVKSLTAIAQNDSFRLGHFSVQDESAALPILLLSPKPGDRVLDMCAAPGGKTTLIGEIMKNQGTIYAVDKYEHKLGLIKSSCERLGISNVETIMADSSTLEMEPVDRIILDVPCSGLGVLRKKPDIKWRRQPEDIAKLAIQQASLLESASRLLKPGGVLVYSTCTIEPEENEGVIRAFLAAHPEFHLDDASQFVNKAVTTPDGFVETFPHRHHIDGSFAARLVKDAISPSQ
jgi:16S rRNA (cytosine967-C5)-methyltransferase